MKNREVSNIKAEEYAQNINAFNFECSTLNNEGVDMLFEMLAGKLYLQKAYRMEAPRESMKVNDKN